MKGITTHNIDAALVQSHGSRGMDRRGMRVGSNEF
jgi:hypothetical protein